MLQFLKESAEHFKESLAQWELDHPELVEAIEAGAKALLTTGEPVVHAPIDTTAEDVKTDGDEEEREEGSQ